MKNNIDPQELQIILDSNTELLSEIKEELTRIRENSIKDHRSNPGSILTDDLLNKIFETIEQAKKAIDKEDLIKYNQSLINSLRQLQDESYQSLSMTLSKKIEELNHMINQRVIIENRYTIDFRSSKTFIAILLLCISIGCSLYFNYNQFQNNKALKHNDIKYRYIQMKGGIIRDDIIFLDNSFPKSKQFRDSIESKVNEFESLVRQKAYNEAVKAQKEKDSQIIDKRLKELTN